MKKNYNVADDEWEWYIGQLYYRIIKNLYKDKIKTVVELAPGFRYKIAYVLKWLNFEGDLYVIDNSDDVLNYIEEKYKNMLPNAKIHLINKDFKNAKTYVPNNIDLFISNHCIDDLIIFNYYNGTYNLNENNKITHDRLLTLWNELYSKEQKQKHIIEDVYFLFKDFFINKQVRLTLMAQYSSNSYYLGESNNMDKITKKCFDKIKNLFITDDEMLDNILDFYPFGKDDDRYNGRYLLDNTQNSINWIVGQIDKV